MSAGVDGMNALSAEDSSDLAKDGVEAPDEEACAVPVQLAFI